jgi:hypothetical protein
MPIVGIMAESGQTTRLGGFYQIATVTTSGLSSYTFSSIPQGYSSLQLRTSTQFTSTAQFNSDTTSGNYSSHEWGFGGLGSASWTYVNYGASQTSVMLSSTYNVSTPAYATVMDIYDYTSTSKLKVTRTLTPVNNGTDGLGISLTSGIWKSTSAITSITINTSSSSTGETFSLYGVK